MQTITDAAIDIVARAIYDVESERNKGARGGDILLPYDECKPWFTTLAKAAVQAMREMEM